jgi:hypothetical protein
MSRITRNGLIGVSLVRPSQGHIEEECTRERLDVHAKGERASERDCDRDSQMKCDRQR